MSIRKGAGKKESVIAAALQGTFGNVSAAARALGLDRRTVQIRIAQSPNLQQVLQDARESMVDNAESALGRAVLAGEAWAVCFALKTQGRARGYVERQEIKQETRLAVTMSAEELTDDELAAIAAGRGARAITQKDGEAEPG